MPKLKKRPDGRYQGKVKIGDGKYKYVYGKSQTEVKKKIDEIRLQVAAGMDLTQNMTLSYWIDRWLARQEQRQTPEWHETCKARAEYWRAAIGDRNVSEIMPADLEDVLLELGKRNPTTGKPSSKKTLTEYKNIICRIFAEIAQNRAISYNPSLFLAVEKTAPKSHRTAISEAQIAAIEATPHKIRLACLIMIYAGLRLGEACALTWSDVNMDKKIINVNKSYCFKSRAVKPPKTEAGNRQVPIPPPLLAVLQAAPRDALLVCHNNGRPYTRCAWEYAAKTYGDALGFPVEAHCLRHTYCTILFEAGVDVLTAQRWMGHADASTTTNIYAHLRDLHARTNVEKLEKYVSGSQTVVKTPNKPRNEAN